MSDCSQILAAIDRLAASTSSLKRDIAEIKAEQKKQDQKLSSIIQIIQTLAQGQQRIIEILGGIVNNFVNAVKAVLLELLKGLFGNKDNEIIRLLNLVLEVQARHGNVLGQIRGRVDDVKKMVGELPDYIKSQGSETRLFVRNEVREKLDFIKERVKGLPDLIKSQASETRLFVRNEVREKLDFIKERVKGLPDLIKSQASETRLFIRNEVREKLDKLLSYFPLNLNQLKLDIFQRITISENYLIGRLGQQLGYTLSAILSSDNVLLAKLNQLLGYFPLNLNQLKLDIFQRITASENYVIGRLAQQLGLTLSAILNSDNVLLAKLNELLGLSKVAIEGEFVSDLCLDPEPGKEPPDPPKHSFEGEGLVGMKSAIVALSKQVHDTQTVLCELYSVTGKAKRWQGTNVYDELQLLKDLFGVGLQPVIAKVKSLRSELFKIDTRYLNTIKSLQDELDDILSALEREQANIGNGSSLTPKFTLSFSSELKDLADVVNLIEQLADVPKEDRARLKGQAAAAATELNRFFYAIKTYHVIGGDRYPAEVPDSIIDKEEGFLGEIFDALLPDKKREISNLTELLGWYVEQFEAVLGAFHQVIQIEDADLTKEGKQSEKIVLPNVAETLAELVTLAVQTHVNTNALIDMGVRTLVEAGSAKKEAFVAQQYARANAEFLNYQGKEVAVELPLSFSLPAAEASDADKENLAKILKDSRQKIQGWEFNDRHDLQFFLTDLLQAAAIIRAVHYQRLDPNADPASEVMALMKRIVDFSDNGLDNSNPDQTRESGFSRFLEAVERGFIDSPGASNTTDPYGRDLERRPRIREIGNTADEET